MLDLLYSILLPLAIAALACYYSIPFLVHAAKGLHILTKVNSRTASQTRIPLLGGFAIFMGMVAGIIVMQGQYSITNLWVFLFACLIMIRIGLKDDIHSLSPIRKLTAEFIAAMVLFLFEGIRITQFHGLFGLTTIPLSVSIFVTLFVVILIINAFNLSDGIDGLAAGIGILAALILGIGFYLNQRYDFALLSSSFAGGLIGFFYFNVYGHKNKLLMGDAGSLLAGLVISLLVIEFNEIPNPNYLNLLPLKTTPILICAILIYPLTDMTQVVICRLWTGKHPFVADRNHLHHKLLDLKFTHKKTSSIIILGNLCFIIINLIFNEEDIPLLIALNVTTVISIVLFIRLYALTYKRSHTVNTTLYIEFKKEIPVYGQVDLKDQHPDSEKLLV